MNKNLFILLGILFSNFCFAQNLFNTEKSDTTNIYRNALAIYCNAIQKNNGNNKVIYVEPNYLLTDSLPKQINNIEIQYPDHIQLKKIIKTHGGHITLVRIIPLKVSNNDFSVSLIPFYTTYKRKRFDLRNGGGLTVFYKFDSEQNGLVYAKHKFGGI